MEPIQDIRLLLAILAPLLGAGLVMAGGTRPNLREALSFLSAVTLFVIAASMVPDIRAGKTLVFPVFQLLPGLSITLRADPLSMIDRKRPNWMAMMCRISRVCLRREHLSIATRNWRPGSRGGMSVRLC